MEVSAFKTPFTCTRCDQEFELTAKMKCQSCTNLKQQLTEVRELNKSFQIVRDDLVERLDEARERAEKAEQENKRLLAVGEFEDELKPNKAVKKYQALVEAAEEWLKCNIGEKEETND